MAPPLDPQTMHKLFFGVWAAIGLGSFVFWQMASPPLKRKVQPYLMIGVGAVFLLFVYLNGAVKEFYFVLIPVLAIMFLNSQTMRICDRCGAMNRPTGFFTPAKFCNKCGSALEK